MILYPQNTIHKGTQKNTFLGIRLDLLVCLFLALSILAVYWQVRNHDFINLDDNVYVAANEHVLSGINAVSVVWAFSFEGKEKTYWHPLTWLSHMLDCQLYGLSPGMHHSTNLIFHIANTLLLFLVFKRMTGDLWKSALVAALFGLHPLNVESVAWVAERKNVLSTLFWLLTIAIYIRYCEHPNFYRYLLLLFLFALGQMAKPMLVTLPFALLLLDYWPLGRLRFGRGLHFFRLFLEKVPLFILSGVSLYISVLSHQKLGIFKSTDTVSILLRIENALVSYISYIVKSLWPNKLAVYYPFPEALALWQTTGAFLLLVFISFTLLVKFKHIPSLTTGWLWYLGTLSPVAGLIQAGLWPAMADRWTYIPNIGLFIIYAWGGSLLFEKLLRQRKWITATAFISFLTSLMIATWVQVQHWESSVSLYQHALTITTNDKTIHYNMGVSLSELGRSKEAIYHYHRVLAITPDFHPAINNLAYEFGRQGNDSKAIQYYKKALKIKPNNKVTYDNMGTALIRQGKVNEAILHYRKALEIDPSFGSAHNNLGQTMLKVGDLEAGISHLIAAFRAQPGNQLTQQSLTLAMDLHKQIKSAAEGLRKSLQFSPDDPALLVRLNTLTTAKEKLVEAIEQYANTFAPQQNFDRNLWDMEKLPGIRETNEEYEKALGLFETAIDIQPKNPAAYYHAACLNARKGDIENSIGHLEMAAKLGFAHPGLFERDQDLKTIRQSVHYNRLLQTFTANAGKTRTNGRRGEP